MFIGIHDMIHTNTFIHSSFNKSSISIDCLKKVKTNWKNTIENFT